MLRRAAQEARALLSATRSLRATASPCAPRNRFASGWCISGPIISRCRPTSRRCSRWPATLENEAIRPHVAGRFADLLLAVEVASRDDPVPRQPGFDRAGLAARAASRPALVGRRSQARHQREPGARNSRAAHARREWRLHAAGRDHVRARADRLVDRHRRGFPRGGAARQVRVPRRGARAGREDDPGHALRARRRRAAARRAARSRRASGDRAASRDQARAALRRRRAARRRGRAHRRRRSATATATCRRCIERCSTCPRRGTAPPSKFKTPHDFVVSGLRMLDFVPQPSRSRSLRR